MRILYLFILGLLAGCGQEEVSAFDLLAVVRQATDGKCNLGYVTHHCRLTMIPSEDKRVIIVTVSAERVWINPGTRGAKGDVDAVVKFSWNLGTQAVTQIE